MTGRRLENKKEEGGVTEVADASAPSSISSPASTTQEENNDATPVIQTQKPDIEFPKLPFRFETGIGLFAKRTPRPFPPPFLSPPSGSFSDPLSTHNRSRDRRQAFVDGQLIRGYTNGDDAVFASGNFICVNDGVGAWSMRPRGHAGFVFSLALFLGEVFFRRWLWLTGCFKVSGRG